MTCAIISSQVNRTLIDDELLEISSTFTNFAILRSCRQAIEVRGLCGRYSHRNISHFRHHGGCDMLTGAFTRVTAWGAKESVEAADGRRHGVDIMIFVAK